jgi:sigma-B regulation protein RsbU (phosphoserine phosphatase)
MFLKKHDMPVPQSLSHAARQRLLVVSGNPYERQSVQRMLQAHANELEVELCDNGVDALVKVGSFKPNVVLLEAQLPDIDGIEICRRLRDNPETENVRVVITGEAMPADAEQRAQEAGAVKCLRRPLGSAELLNALGGSPSGTATHG